MPLRTQQWIQKPQRQERGASVHSNISTNSCAVPSRGASGNMERERNWRGKQPKVETRAGVTHISAGVHSGYQMVRGDICLEHMHTLWSSPGEKGGNVLLWLLILFLPTYLIPYWSYLGGGECDATKAGASVSLQGRTQPVRKQREQKNPKIRGTVKCVEVVELSKISYLKVPSVEWRCFVLFCFNHQRSTVPSSSVTSLTLQVHSLQIYTLSSIFLPTERTLFAFGTPLSEKSNLAVLMSSLG